MTDRLAELGALQYAVENLSTAGTSPNRLGLGDGSGNNTWEPGVFGWTQN